MTVCEFCGEVLPTNKTRFCFESCRAKHYRKKYQINEIDTLIREKKIDKTHHSIANIIKLGYDVTITKKERFI